jgi:hypothetical protein
MEEYFFMLTIRMTIFYVINVIYNLNKIIILNFFTFF